MTRLATERLLLAVLVTVAGGLVAVLAGIPEAAVLAVPWMVLLALGLARAGGGDVSATIDVVDDRVLVGDDIEVVTTVIAEAGSVEVTCLPAEGFGPRVSSRELARAGGVAEVLIAGRARLRSPLPATRWGTHDVGRVRLEVTEPYGLFRWVGVARSPLRVRVHPTAADLQNLLAPWLVRRVSGAHGSRAAGRGVEYADIRPFGSGDSLRDINWRASARSQELWVSQRHPDCGTDVILLLDSFVESGHDVHTVVGLAIEAAVGLAESHLSVTDRVGLIELGGVLRWVAPGTGRLQLQRLTDALLATGLHASAAERDLEGIPARVLPPRSFVVALTPLLDERFVDALFLLAGRGHDVAVIECALIEGAGGVEGSAAAVARRLWEAERDIVRDRLAAHGVSIAEWRAGDHLDPVLGELTRRRQRTIRTATR